MYSVIRSGFDRIYCSLPSTEAVALSLFSCFHIFEGYWSWTAVRCQWISCSGATCRLLRVEQLLHFVTKHCWVFWKRSLRLSSLGDPEPPTASREHSFTAAHGKSCFENKFANLSDSGAMFDDFRMEVWTVWRAGQEGHCRYVLYLLGRGGRWWRPAVDQNLFEALILIGLCNDAFSLWFLAGNSVLLSLLN